MRKSRVAGACGGRDRAEREQPPVQFRPGGAVRGGAGSAALAPPGLPAPVSSTASGFPAVNAPLMGLLS